MSKQDREGWYTDAKSYWDKADSTDHGMLGGYEQTSEIDARSNSEFIKQHISDQKLNLRHACDCGAGIGRVSRTFLLKHFEKVTLVEQTEKFLETARVNFGEQGLLHRIDFKPIGLQDFNPTKGEYDLIWCQWVLSHLRDNDLVSFLKRCKDSLDGGYIGIKENVAEAGIVYDDEDSSCTRSDFIFKNLFEEAGLILVKEDVQRGFPSKLFVVKMYLLK